MPATWQAMDGPSLPPRVRKVEYLSSLHGHVCIMEFRKRGTSVASATSKFACCRMCARLQDHCDGSVLSSRLLPARRRKKKTQSRQKNASPPDLTRRRTQEATHAGSAGGRQAEQGRWPGTLLEHAINKGLPGMCTFESDSTNWSIRVSGCLTSRRVPVGTP